MRTLRNDVSWLVARAACDPLKAFGLPIFGISNWGRQDGVDVVNVDDMVETLRGMSKGSPNYALLESLVYEAICAIHPSGGC